LLESGALDSGHAVPRKIECCFKPLRALVVPELGSGRIDGLARDWFDIGEALFRQFLRD
jgi:hypothetical protein